MVEIKQLNLSNFRLLLTRESTETFRLIMEVVKQVIKAAQEKLEADRQKQKGTANPYQPQITLDRDRSTYKKVWDEPTPSSQQDPILLFRHKFSPKDRVPTAPGKPGNPGKMVTVFPAWKNPGILSFLPNILEK